MIVTPTATSTNKVGKAVSLVIASKFLITKWKLEKKWQTAELRWQQRRTQLGAPHVPINNFHPSSKLYAEGDD
jgi:hypothetical protein